MRMHMHMHMHMQLHRPARARTQTHTHNNTQNRCARFVINTASSRKRSVAALRGARPLRWFLGALRMRTRARRWGLGRERRPSALLPTDAETACAAEAEERIAGRGAARTSCRARRVVGSVQIVAGSTADRPQMDPRSTPKWAHIDRSHRLRRLRRNSLRRDRDSIGCGGLRPFGGGDPMGCGILWALAIPLVAARFGGRFWPDFGGGGPMSAVKLGSASMAHGFGFRPKLRRGRQLRGEVGQIGDTRVQLRTALRRSWPKLDRFAGLATPAKFAS